MADLEKTVSIIFAGDDRVSRTVSSLTTKFGQFSTVADTITQPMARVADGVLAADAALGALVAGGMALAIREAGKFGDAFAEITTLIDAPADRLQGFKSDILDYATTSTASIEDINASIYTAISAGTDWSRSLDLLSTSEKLATAGKAELEATVRLLASTLNAYGENVDQATRYSDVFFKTVKEGQTTLPELADSMSQVTGIAANAGVPIETLMAALAALTATGAPTSQAITQIRGAISAIIKPSSQAVEIAEELGIQFNATALQTKGFEGILNEVYQATDGNVEVMAKLFGRVEGLNAALVLGADKSGKFAQSLKSMQNAAGATEAAFKKMEQNINQIAQTIENNVRAVFVKTGENLLDPFRDAAGGINEILQGIGKGIDAGAFNELFQAFDDLAANIKAYLSEVAKVIPDALADVDFSGLLDAFGDLGDAISRFFDGIDLRSAEGLTQAIQGAVDTMEALVRVTAGMAEAFRPYFDVLREAVQNVNQMDEAQLQSIGNMLAFAKVVATVGAAIGGAVLLMDKYGISLETIFGVLGGLGTTVLASIAAAIDRAKLLFAEAARILLGLAEVVTSIPGFEELNEKIEAARQKVNEFSESVQTSLSRNSEDIVRGLGRAFDAVTGEAGKAASSVEKVANAVKKLPEKANIPIKVDPAGVALKDAEEISIRLDELSQERAIEILPISPPKHFDILERDINSRLSKMSPKVEAKATANTKQAEMDLDRLNIAAGLIESSMKYEAQVNIAEAEAAARRVESAFESVNVGIQSTGETIQSLWSILAGEDLNISERLRLESTIEREMKLREKEFELQEALARSQIEYNDARSDAIKSGENFLTVRADGLKPHLEGIWFEIMEALQVRLVEESAETLLGLG